MIKQHQKAWGCGQRRCTTVCSLLSAGHHRTECSTLTRAHTTCLSFSCALRIVKLGLDSDILAPLKSVASSRDLKTEKSPASIPDYLITNTNKRSKPYYNPVWYLRGDMREGKALISTLVCEGLVQHVEIEDSPGTLTLKSKARRSHSEWCFGLPSPSCSFFSYLLHVSNVI